MTETYRRTWICRTCGASTTVSAPVSASNFLLQLAGQLAGWDTCVEAVDDPARGLCPKCNPANVKQPLKT